MTTDSKTTALDALDRLGTEEVEAWVADSAKELGVKHEPGLFQPGARSRQLELFAWRVLATSPRKIGGLDTVEKMTGWGDRWEALCRVIIWKSQSVGARFDVLRGNGYPTSPWMEVIPQGTLRYLPNHVFRVLNYALDEGNDLREQRYGEPSVGAALWKAIGEELEIRRKKGTKARIMGLVDAFFDRCVECGLDLTELSVLDAFATETSRLRACVEAGAKLSDALGVALWAGNLEAAGWLLSQGADPNAELGGIPVFYYAKKTREQVELLDGAGADRSLPGYSFYAYGDTSGEDAPLKALRAAMRLSLGVPRNGVPKREQDTHERNLLAQRNEVANLLSSADDLRHPRGLLAAVMVGDRELVAQALEGGADPNAVVDYCGRWTPLVAAVELDAADIVRTLLEAGANPAVTPGYHVEPPAGRRLVFPALASVRSVEVYDLLRQKTELDSVSRAALLRLLGTFKALVDPGPTRLVNRLLNETQVSEDEVEALEARIELHKQKNFFPKTTMALLRASAEGRPLASKPASRAVTKPIATVYANGSFAGFRIATEDLSSALAGTHSVCLTRDQDIALDPSAIRVEPLSKLQAARVMDALGQKFDTYALPDEAPEAIEPAAYTRGKEAFVVVVGTFAFGDDEASVTTVDILPSREWPGFSGAWKSSFSSGGGRLPFDDLRDFGGTNRIESWEDFESRLSVRGIDKSTKSALDKVLPESRCTLRGVLGRLRRQ